MQTSRLGFVAALVIAAACGAPPPSPSPVETLPAAGLAKLDQHSRALLEQLGPGEWAVGDLTLTDAVAAQEARRRAADAGLQLGPAFAQAVTIHVLGPPAAIVAAGTDASVVTVELHEDDRATRAVAAPLPASQLLPVPGTPYATRRLLFPPGVGSTVPADRRALLLAALADAITTIDGQPYTEVDTDESCDVEPPACQMSLTGRRQEANLLAQDDQWRAQVPMTDAAGDATVSGIGASALPRWLAREAERIARSDPATAALIGRYATLSTFRWASGGNLVVFIEYARPCEGLDCTNHLTVAVDPGAGTVLDVTED